MKCEIESFLVTVDGGHRTWTPHMPSTSQTVCRTHGWQFQTGQPVGADDLCPIGRIEDAVEKGVQRILDAVSQSQPGSGAAPKYDPPPGTIAPFIHGEVPDGWEPLHTINPADYPEGSRPIVNCMKMGAQSDGLPLGYLLHFYRDKVPKGWEIIQTITSEGVKPIVLCKKVET